MGGAESQRCSSLLQKLFFVCVFLFILQRAPSPPPPKKNSVVLVPRVLALGTLVENRRTLVRGTQLHRVELQPPVPALDARLVDGRSDPRRRGGHAARRLRSTRSFPVFADRVRSQRSELVSPAVVMYVGLADDGDGLEVYLFFFSLERGEREREGQVEVFDVEVKKKKKLANAPRKTYLRAASRSRRRGSTPRHARRPAPTERQ